MSQVVPYHSLAPELWLLVPGLPLLMALLMIRWRQALGPWVWLSCLPALALALWPSASLPLGALWPGAQWGLADPVNRAFLGFTALLWACASPYAWASQAEHPRRGRFMGFWLLSLSGNLLLIIAQDGASFYVGFTLMSLSAYGLVVHLGGPGPRQAGRLYLQLAVLGEMLLHAGLLLRLHEAGGLYAFADWRSTPISGLTASLLLLGFGLKAGFWPLHIWLPLAHPAAPAAASAVLSGAMIKAGILGLWRFTAEADPLLASWAPWLFGVGLVSAFYGVALGLVQTKAKTALAYSSISQVGYLLAILALAWLVPEARPLTALLLALYAAHHGLAKGALFMGAGLASSHRLSRLHWVLMALPALALAGLPFTSGAAAKTLLKLQLDASPLAPWLLALSLGALASSLLVARVLWLMRKSQKGLESLGSAGSRLPLNLALPWALLCLMPLLLPWLWPAMRGQLLASLSPYASWSLLWPLLVAGALIALVIAKGWTLPKPLRQLPQPARYLSLYVYRLAKRPPVPLLEPRLDADSWRARERRWNRFWQSANPLTLSAWVLGLLLVIGWAQ